MADALNSCRRSHSLRYGLISPKAAGLRRIWAAATSRSLQSVGFDAHFIEFSIHRGPPVPIGLRQYSPSQILKTRFDLQRVTVGRD
jgi:hypothetical protein